MVEAGTRLVIWNPVARGADRAKDALGRAAEADGVRLGWHETQPDSSIAEQTAKLLAGGASDVIVIGGDGTVRAVAGAVAGTGVNLAILPAGAGNVYARNLGLRARALRRNVAVALHGEPRAFDLGWVDFDLGRPEPFCTMVGVGRDVEVVRAADQRAKGRLAWGAYAVAGLAKLRAKPLLISVDDKPGRYWTVLIGNAPRVPLGATVFPGVAPDDGQLSVLRVGAPGLREWADIAAFGLGKRADAPKLAWSSATSVELSWPGRRSIQIDGDVVSDVERLTVRVQPGATRVRTP